MGLELTCEVWGLSVQGQVWKDGVLAECTPDPVKMTRFLLHVLLPA